MVTSVTFIDSLNAYETKIAKPGQTFTSSVHFCHHLYITSQRLIGIKPRKGFQDRLGHSRHGTARHKLKAPLWAADGTELQMMNLEEVRITGLV